MVQQVTRDNTIEAAKNTVPVIDLADLLCGPGQMRRVGKEWVARCPLPDHEDRSPSFTVDADKNVWFCHGCLRGGDVVRLAAYMWGYAPRTREEKSAAAHVLHEFGHDIPQRPASWFAKNKRQERARSALHRARVEAARRRCYRLMLRDLEASGETDPSEAERELLWEAAGRIAVLLIADREQSEARCRAQPRGAA